MKEIQRAKYTATEVTSPYRIRDVILSLESPAEVCAEIPTLTTIARFLN